MWSSTATVCSNNNSDLLIDSTHIKFVAVKERNKDQEEILGERTCRDACAVVRSAPIKRNFFD